MHESVPIYSGGLGVLSGDHIKSASGLGVPLVAIGLFYDQGYFKQQLDDRRLSAGRVSRHAGRESADGAGHRHGRQADHRLRSKPATARLLAKVWLMHVGRVPLYLLDCDVEGNSPQDRELTSRLYGGDVRTRIRQELVLGVGGVKALRALGIMPGVYHLNEGHSAFAPLEVDSPADARRRPHVRRSAPRGRPSHRVHHAHAGAGRTRPLRRPIWSKSILGPLRDKLGISHDAAHGPGPRRAAERARAVLHDGDRPQALAAGQRGELAARPRVAADVGPPLAVARGGGNPHRPHHQRRAHSDVARLPDAPALRPAPAAAIGSERMGDPKVWQNLYNVDPGELWETHNALKNRLLDFVRRRVSRQVRRRNEPDEVVEAARTVLDPNALTIGFARRFATYKRADLFFRQLDELAELVNDPQRPVQFDFRRQGPPGRRAGQAAHQEDRQPAARSAVRRPRSCSSRTTTSTSRGTWCRASTCGSTIRAGRRRPPAPAA